MSKSREIVVGEWNDAVWRAGCAREEYDRLARDLRRQTAITLAIEALPVDATYQQVNAAGQRASLDAMLLSAVDMDKRLDAAFVDQENAKLAMLAMDEADSKP